MTRGKANFTISSLESRQLQLAFLCQSAKLCTNRLNFVAIFSDIYALTFPFNFGSLLTVLLDILTTSFSSAEMYGAIFYREKKY